MPSSLRHSPRTVNRFSVEVGSSIDSRNVLMYREFIFSLLNMIDRSLKKRVPSSSCSLNQVSSTCPEVIIFLSKHCSWINFRIYSVYFI